jgi:predicted RNase H-like HicB family nuclease
MAAEKFLVELEREDDGRWIAEVVLLPGVVAYGATRDEALARVEVLALRVLADRLEHGEAIPQVTRLFEAA